MPLNYTNYSQNEAKLVGDYLANNSHTGKANTSKWQREISRTAEKSFQQMNFNNKKAAAKLQRENQEFGMAVNLAALLSEIKLLIHYKTMVEKILEVRAEVDTKAQERYHAMLADQRNPFPVALPQPTQSAADYKQHVLNDAQIFLDSLSEKQTALQTRIQASWGADNWQDGLEKQAQALHEKINASIENYEFLNVIETAEGNNIDITQYAPAVAENARTAMHAVNDALKSFINEMPPPSPDYKDFSVVIGAEAPLAPTLDPEFAATFKTSNGIPSISNLELFTVNEYRNGFGKIGEPLVKEKELAVDATSTTTTNANSTIRLALRSTDVIADDLKNVVDKAQKFVNDSHLLNDVNKLIASAKQDVVKLDTELKATLSPRPRPG